MKSKYSKYLMPVRQYVVSCDPGNKSMSACDLTLVHTGKPTVKLAVFFFHVCETEMFTWQMSPSSSKIDELSESNEPQHWGNGSSPGDHSGGMVAGSPLCFSCLQSKPVSWGGWKATNSFAWQWAWSNLCLSMPCSVVQSTALTLLYGFQDVSNISLAMCMTVYTYLCWHPRAARKNQMWLSSLLRNESVEFFFLFSLPVTIKGDLFLKSTLNSHRTQVNLLVRCCCCSVVPLLLASVCRLCVVMLKYNCY